MSTPTDGILALIHAYDLRSDAFMTLAEKADTSGAAAGYAQAAATWALAAATLRAAVYEPPVINIQAKATPDSHDARNIA